MSKAAVIYWSQTGNTQQMAEAVAQGITDAGAEAEVFTVSDISAQDAAQYTRLALGCPAMGSEVLEEEEFAPFFEALQGSLSGKKVALFGSYGWGDGEWMRTWEDTCRKDGAVLVSESVICNAEPGEDGVEQCEALGADLV